MTSCLQRPLFWGPIFSFHNIKLPLKNDHLSKVTNKLGVPRVAVEYRFDFTFKMNTVKPVYNNQPWYHKIVIVVDRWRVIQRYLYALKVQNETSKW